jgi:hypothetical protein
MGGERLLCDHKVPGDTVACFRRTTGPRAVAPLPGPTDRWYRCAGRALVRGAADIARLTVRPLASHGGGVLPARTVSPQAQ